jgi:hypothetical protein
MRRPLTAQLALVLGISLAVSSCGEPKYPAFEVTSRENPADKFHFSAADATSSSPVVMTAVGRELTLADRKHRVNLQKRWAAEYIPENLSFLSYGTAECGLKRKDEMSVCFVMDFEDPVAKEQVTYYFYGGNWPLQ